jgi:hypothetical protein
MNADAVESSPEPVSTPFFSPRGVKCVAEDLSFDDQTVEIGVL